jgi:ABC-type spermidine/putrescine transport system permease subunit I
MNTFLSLMAMLLAVSASMLLGVEIAYRIQKEPLPRWANIWLSLQSVALVTLLMVRIMLWVYG